MQENQEKEINLDTNVQKKQASLEEKTELLLKKISEVAGENLELKDRLYQKKDLYFQQEKQLRHLRKRSHKMQIQIEILTNSMTEQVNTARALSKEIQNIKTLVRYLLSHEVANFYHASSNLFTLPKKILFSKLEKQFFLDGLQALKTMFLMPLKLKKIYYFRKLKKTSPVKKEEKETLLSCSFPPYFPERTEGLTKKILRIACILDEFSFSCFQYEAKFTQLEFDHWKEQLDTENFDLLFIESAWKGKNLNWKNKIGGLSDAKNSTLGKLVSEFKKKGIPTVFWNKEDPPHFEHFLEAAKLFDFVFTSDENQIPNYEEALGHSRIQSLSFACQPILHNPIGSNKEKVGEVAFAGSWHENKHESRKIDMHNLLRPALEYKLHIFDRMANHLLDNYIFPFEYQHTIQGSLPYNKMLSAYRGYEVFLNVNSVQNSRTMFSRRVYEIAACGVNIITGYTQGIEDVFGKDLICSSLSEEDTKKHLNTLFLNREENKKRAHQAKRIVYEKHTYAHRLETILSAIGFSFFAKPKKHRVAVFAELTDIKNLDLILKNFKQQAYEEKSLHLLCETKEIAEFCKNTLESENNFPITLHEKEADHSFYEFLFTHLQKINFDYLTIFNEKYYYAPFFLTDFLHTFLYSGTFLATKMTYYSICPKEHTVLEKILAPEHQVGSVLNENCFLAKKEVFLDPFIKERLTLDMQTFTNSCLELGYDIYNSDKFNYLEILDGETKDLEEAFNFVRA
jgi:spore maturation protein CgeB